MTIESTSHPNPLADWDGTNPKVPFYLELFGETRPAIDTTYAEVVPAGAADGTAKTTASAPIYEYWWTIGHPGHGAQHGGMLDRLLGPKNLWERLADPAARVYLFFPLGGGWRVKELVATVKYLSPLPHEHSFMAKAAEEWQTLAPIAEGASKLMSAAGSVAVPGGAVLGKSAKMLDGLARTKLGSVPQVSGFEWSATKVTFGSREHGGVMQGVMWTLPKSMFTELGGRLTGSLAVTFIPDNQQQAGTVAADPAAPQMQDLLAHAVVYGPDDAPYWAPAEREFIRLRLSPRLGD